MKNNPVVYNDPSGHGYCDEEGNCYLDQLEKVPSQKKDLRVENIIRKTAPYNGIAAGNYAYDHWKDFVPNCGLSCTEFVSTAMHEGGGYPETESWNSDQSCFEKYQPWNNSIASYHYLVDIMGYSTIEINIENPQETYKNIYIPPGMPVFYDTGWEDEKYPKATFMHAAITTNNIVTEGGITGREVVDHNGILGRPHLLSVTSVKPARIVIVLVGIYNR